MHYDLNSALKGPFLKATTPDGTAFYVPFWNNDPEIIVQELSAKGTAPGSALLVSGDLKDRDGYKLYLKGADLSHTIDSLEEKYDLNVDKSSLMDLKELGLSETWLVSAPATISVKNLIRIVDDPNILALRPLAADGPKILMSLIQQLNFVKK